MPNVVTGRIEPKLGSVGAIAPGFIESFREPVKPESSNWEASGPVVDEARGDAVPDRR